MAGVKEVDSTDRFSLADVGRDSRSSGEKKMKEESKPPHAKTCVWGTHLRTNGLTRLGLSYPQTLDQGVKGGR